MKIFRRIFIILLVLPLISCAEEIVMGISGEVNGHPIFCFASAPFSRCGEGGESLEEVSVIEVDRMGKEVVTVWKISSVPYNRILANLEYGATPEGWKEIIKPVPLKNGTYYKIDINRYFFFSRKHDGRYIVYDDGEFYEKLKNNDLAV